MWWSCPGRLDHLFVERPVQRRGLRRLAFVDLVCRDWLFDRPLALLGAVRADRRGTARRTPRKAVFTESEVGNAAATSGSSTTAMARPLRSEA
jgi:hypothetical protein